MISPAKLNREIGESYPPAWAAGLRRLNPDQPIEGWQHPRWLALVQDAWDILTEWGSEAHRLGWTAADLFGVDPVAPVHRLDRAGLAVVIARGWVDRIEGDAIHIRSRAGAALTFSKPAKGGVPIWEIEV